MDQYCKVLLSWFMNFYTLATKRIISENFYCKPCGSFLSFHVSVLSGCFISLFNSPLAQTERPCKQDYQLDINYVQGDNMSFSCLTTTHELESLTVKLRRTNPVKDILICSDTSLASEHQRWSVRNVAGNVTVYLKDISLSDDGLYDCQVYNGLDCLKVTQFNLSVISKNAHFSIKLHLIAGCFIHFAPIPWSISVYCIPY